MALAAVQMSSSAETRECNTSVILIWEINYINYTYAGARYGGASALEAHSVEMGPRGRYAYPHPACGLGVATIRHEPLLLLEVGLLGGFLMRFLTRPVTIRGELASLYRTDVQITPPLVPEVCLRPPPSPAHQRHGTPDEADQCPTLIHCLAARTGGHPLKSRGPRGVL